MKNLNKLVLPGLGAVLIIVIYFLQFAPTDKLGDFSKFGGSEINQKIIVAIDKSLGFGKNMRGEIVTFFALDKKNFKANVNMHGPAPEGLENAEIVELFGHIHGNDFGAETVTIIR